MTSTKGPIIDPGMCRCCGALKKCRLLNVEYIGLGQKEIYSDMFVDCYGLVLSHLDAEPEDCLICATCVMRLREANCFRLQVLECEQKFLRSKILIHGDDKDTEIELEKYQLDKKNYDNDEQTDARDYISQDTEPLQDERLHLKIKSTSPKKPLKILNETKIRKKLKSKIKGQIGMVIKRFKPGSIKQSDKKVRENLPDDKCQLNVITIIENSYVCPFNSFFNNYYCFYCRLKFMDCRKLREHSLTHDPNLYKDVFRNTMRGNNRKNQIDLHRIDCRLCDEKICDIETFKSHISMIHGKTIYPINDDFIKFRLTASNLKCTECERTFSYFHTLKKHMAEHFGACICDVCGIHYFDKRMLIAHIKSHEKSIAKYRCKQCGKVFKSKYNMVIHNARLHTKEALYLCTKCDDRFFSDTLRHRHMIDAHGEESIFKCDHCDKAYNNKKTLRDHYRRMHLKLLKHQCSLCEKRFYLPCRLKEHMVSHTGERNFRCEHCGKSYSRLRALKVHMNSHASEKKFKCTICNASYNQNVCLKNHIKRHHQQIELEEILQQ